MKSSRYLAATLLSCLAGASQAEPIYGITVPDAGGTSLVSFDSATPNVVTTIGAITGIAAGQTLRGIDFRPATGDLYALSSNGAAAQLYTIDLTTGVASAVGAALTLTGNTSTRISLDFNPVVDRLRIVTGTGQNYRANVDTGALTQDTDITPGPPLISGIAYSNNFAGATQTTLYAYDFLLDNVGTIGGINGVPSPNGGLFNVIGGSGIVTFNAGLGFDISGATGTAYVTVDDFGSPGSNAEFFSVNLATGAFTQLSSDDFSNVLDISVSIARPPVNVPLPATLALVLLGAAAMRVSGWRGSH